MQDLIAKLNSRISKSAGISALQRKIMDRLDPSREIAEHQRIKPLWYGERMLKIFEGKPDDVRPVNMEFVPSLDCNLQCPPCTYTKWKARTASDQGRRQASLEIMKTVYDRLEDGGVKGVTVTGGGEPLLNPFTIDGIEYAAKKSFSLGLFTNGTLLTPGSIDRLAGAGLSFFRISINSGDCENYLQFHGVRNPAIFGKVKRNIGLAGAALNRTATKFGLGMIVSAVNVEYMRSLAELARVFFRAGFRVQARLHHVQAGA